MLIQYITIDAVNWFGGGAEGWRIVAIIYAIVGLIINTISVFSVKELPEADKEIEKERKEEHTLTFFDSFKLLSEEQVLCHHLHYIHYDTAICISNRYGYLLHEVHTWKRRLIQ